LLINLASVPYMDSTGLGAMVHASATATRQGGSVKLLNSTKKLHDLLVITKLATVFETRQRAGRPRQLPRRRVRTG
jgi:anti-sigma B factor antagonist